MTVEKPHSLSVTATDPLFASYVQIAKSLLPSTLEACLVGPALQTLGSTSGVAPARLVRWYQQARATDSDDSALCTSLDPGTCVTALRIQQADGRQLGALFVQQASLQPPADPRRYAQQVMSALKPLLDCIHRDLAAAYPPKSRLRTMTERSSELEWLFKLTNSLREASDDRHLIDQLVSAAARRLGAGYGALYVPSKRLCVERSVDPESAAMLAKAWARAKHRVLTYVQRQHNPLVVNGSRKKKADARLCKVLAVPVVRENGFVIGVLAFFKPPDAVNFTDTNVFLARHLGRQAGQVVEMQYDLVTGLHTRGSLEEMTTQLFKSGNSSGSGLHSLIHLDIDYMHVVNELHGFEIGNELIVRVADLLVPPLLPADAMAARLGSDRFAIVLPWSDAEKALEIAESIREAAGRLVLGPVGKTIDVALSGGVAPLTDVAPSFQRALAAAELACKTAKTRGRNRIEMYAFEDESMMRRHGDVVAVGRLREALKAERFTLFAQPIVALGTKSSYSGYEILLRIRNDDGSVSSPGDLIEAAGRYQLLPMIDKWVTRHALEMLAPYRGMLGTRNVSMSLNVTGQSMCDESFVTQLAQNLKEARLPADCITFEITEQAAVTNLARANNLITHLKSFGCQFALDDFGTGANSLTTLQSLQIARIKIDGSFVRNVATDRGCRSTVRAIVELAAGLSIDTVAEFVETQQIAEEVRALGVDFAQGYAFGRPEPLGEILKLLNEDESRRMHRLFLES
jgi:diguanylate cyclase (GGDEF)-like protein